MTKSTKVKLSQTLLLLFLFTLFCCLNGCGPEGGGATDDKSISLTATPSDVAVDDMSIVEAYVQDEYGLQPGINVTFGFQTNNSGASLSVVNRTTDLGGRAVAIYAAGDNSPGLTLQDVIYADVEGSASSVIISRLPDTETGNRVTLSLNPTALTATDGTSVVTAAVTTDSGAGPVAGVTVSFSIVSGGGSLSAMTAVTNNSGRATVIFTGPGGAAGGQAIIGAWLSGEPGYELAVVTW